MRYIFIVQGEGRGHMTQALTLAGLLRSRGHQIVKVLVGRSPERTLPDFFVRGIGAPVEQFESMNFLPSADNRKANMVGTVLLNSLNLPSYYPSIQFIREAVRTSSADVVLNFYELMAGMTYFFHEIDVPMISIGHQYLFMHRDFGLPRHKFPASYALDFFSRLTSVGSVKHLALSFREMEDDDEHDIIVVPPLLREEVYALETTDGDYLHGYMLNAGFAEDVLSWHKEHPEVPLHFFWDKRGADKVTKVDGTLSFHMIDDREFLSQMAGCHAYASTAGFESVCEAMWMGKPILMVPSHIEQEINAFDAQRSGAGIVSDKFDLSQLLEFSETYIPNENFRKWASQASELIIKELEEF